MATGAKKGLVPARTLGSGPDNKGLEEYTIANQYSTSLFLHDPVKLGSDGTVQQATNGSDALGVLMGVVYTNAEGQEIDAKYWPKNTDSDSTPLARVLSEPQATFRMVADGTVDQVQSGNLYSVAIGSGDTSTGSSVAVAEVIARQTGSEDLSGVSDLGANSSITDGDKFDVKSSVANSNVTVTISDGDGVQDLLDAINAVAGVSAQLTSGGFLEISASDGGDLVTSDGTGTPLADIGITAGTTNPTKAAGSAMVKARKVVDSANNVLEVSLSRHEYRDDA